LSNVAAIDCGTNSTRLLIVDEHGKTLCRLMRMTRLGQDVDATGELAADALDRTYSVLREFASAMADLSVGRSSLIATSAARDASNGEAFLLEAERVTGAEVALLSGLEEAELSYRGATADLDETAESIMIVDVGGGSTELATEIDGAFSAYSMQIGCVRVTERALGSGVVVAESAQRAWAMIDDELNRAITATPVLDTLRGRVRLVGLAGTVATLAQLDAELAEYNRDAVHHRMLSIDVVQKWRLLLASETPEARLSHAGMVPGREDVLVGGLFVLESVMRRFDCTEVLSSECDVLDGLASTLLTTQDQ
jgi:exopolyphosphatase/guanosine-5'-triphosphate,3'-diphosphate pyrophosphatase